MVAPTLADRCVAGNRQFTRSDLAQLHFTAAIHTKSQRHVELAQPFKLTAAGLSLMLENNAATMARP